MTKIKRSTTNKIFSRLKKKSQNKLTFVTGTFSAEFSLFRQLKKKIIEKMTILLLLFLYFFCLREFELATAKRLLDNSRFLRW